MPPCGITLTKYRTYLHENKIFYGSGPCKNLEMFKRDAESVAIFELKKIFPSPVAKLCMMYRGLPNEFEMKFDIFSWSEDRHDYIRSVQPIPKTDVHFHFPNYQILDIEGSWFFRPDDTITLRLYHKDTSKILLKFQEGSLAKFLDVSSPLRSYKFSNLDCGDKLIFSEAQILALQRMNNICYPSSHVKKLKTLKRKKCMSHGW